MPHPWQLTTQLIIFQHKKKDIFQGHRNRGNLQNWLKWRHFASAVFFMALVFCLNLRCSLGCPGSEDSPQQAFCHLWVEDRVKWLIACGFVTPGFDTRLTWSRAAPQQVEKDSVFFCREFQCKWKCFHSCLGKEYFERQRCCTLPLERTSASSLSPFQQQEGGPVQQLQAQHHPSMKHNIRATALSGRSRSLILGRFSPLLFARDRCPAAGVQSHRALLKHTVIWLLTCVF